MSQELDHDFELRPTEADPNLYDIWVDGVAHETYRNLTMDDAMKGVHMIATTLAKEKGASEISMELGDGTHWTFEA